MHSYMSHSCLWTLIKFILHYRTRQNIQCNDAIPYIPSSQLRKFPPCWAEDSASQAFLMAALPLKLLVFLFTIAKLLHNTLMTEKLENKLLITPTGGMKSDLLVQFLLGSPSCLLEIHLHCCQSLLLEILECKVNERPRNSGFISSELQLVSILACKYIQFSSHVHLQIFIVDLSIVDGRDQLDLI